VKKRERGSAGRTPSAEKKRGGAGKKTRIRILANYKEEGNRKGGNEDGPRKQFPARGGEASTRKRGRGQGISDSIPSHRGRSTAVLAGKKKSVYEEKSAGKACTILGVAARKRNGRPPKNLYAGKRRRGRKKNKKC